MTYLQLSGIFVWLYCKRVRLHLVLAVICFRCFRFRRYVNFSSFDVQFAAVATLRMYVAGIKHITSPIPTGGIFKD